MKNIGGSNDLKNLNNIYNEINKKIKPKFKSLKITDIYYNHLLINNKYLHFFIFLINCIHLGINIYFWLIRKYNKFLLRERNNNYMDLFKNIDFIPIYLMTKSFKNISLYLNSKYNSKKVKNNIIFPESVKKKLIRFYSTTNNNKKYGEYYKSIIIEGLQDKFIFNFTSENPDYLIYDTDKKEELEYKFENTIKIALYTENNIPDFIHADYAIGFHNMNYLDRYFRRTTLIMIFENRYINIKNIDFMKKRKETLHKKIRKKFCAAVISNDFLTDGFRLKFIKELDKYKKVDMGGKAMNNVGMRVKDKIKFLSNYKFSIAMENSEGQGYVSEKILDSFFAGTIPIYYGGYMVDEFINPKSFILIKGEKDMKEKIEYIKKIDNDDKLYKSILKEQLFINDNLLEINKREKKAFFKNIFEQNKDKAKRIDDYQAHLLNL